MHFLHRNDIYALPTRNFPWEMLPFCHFIRTRLYVIVSDISKNPSCDLTLSPLTTIIKISLQVNQGMITSMRLCIKARKYKQRMNKSCEEDEFICNEMYLTLQFNVTQ